MALLDRSGNPLLENPWVVILAQTARDAGPTIELAAQLTPPARILLVLAQEGETVANGPGELPAANVCVQPRDRGTATSLLLAVTHIEQHQPEAEVIVLLAGAHVDDELALTSAIGRARLALRLPDAATVLLGVIPDSDRVDPGWIVPGPRCGGGPTLRIRHLVPARRSGRRVQAEALADAVWNTGILVSTVPALLGLFAHALPRALAAFHRDPAVWDDWRPWVREAIYDVFPNLDLRGDLLESCAPLLRLLPVPCCGWRPTRVRAEPQPEATAPSVTPHL